MIDMGGGNKTKATTTTPAAPAAPAVQMQSFPAFMPGQQGLLAEQMSAGFGAPVSENMGLLSNLYKPVNMPMISRPDQIAQYLAQIGLKPVTTDTKAAADDWGKKTDPKTSSLSNITNPPRTKASW